MTSERLLITMYVVTYLFCVLEKVFHLPLCNVGVEERIAEGNHGLDAFRLIGVIGILS